MDIIEKKLTDIKPYEHNPRLNDEAVRAVKNSIKEFGFKVPIVIDENGVIICGHTRYKAAKELALQSVPCVLADDLSEDEAKAFRIADNKVQEKSEWNVRLLSEELQEISLDYDVKEFGFEKQELKLLIGEEEEPSLNTEPKSICNPKKRIIIIFGKDCENEIRDFLGEKGPLKASYVAKSILNKKEN